MKKISLIMLLILLFMVTGIYSQAPTGSNSLMHIQTARTFDAGRFELKSDLNFYTKLSENLGNLSPDNFQSVNFWVVNSGLALTFGATDHFDITVAPGIYQDTNLGGNLPDDIRLFLKIGSFDFANRHMYWATQLGTRFPIGEYHNYPFTYYAGPSVEYGLSGFLSYYSDPYLPDRSFSTHLNIGFWNHNEAGEKIWRSLTSSVNSVALTYGIGLVYPTDLFNFQLEFTGLTYIEQPDQYVFSREDWMYVTPGIKYKPLSWLDVNFGVDIRVSEDVDESIPRIQQDYNDRGLPNYAAWKAHLGLEITILPITSSSSSSTQVEREQFNQRVEFFQQIIEDRERSENIKEELDKLKEERESAEQELEELKQILEEEGN
jgi:hypothetical protein